MMWKIKVLNNHKVKWPRLMVKISQTAQSFRNLHTWEEIEMRSFQHVDKRDFYSKDHIIKGLEKSVCLRKSSPSCVYQPSAHEIIERTKPHIMRHQMKRIQSNLKAAKQQRSLETNQRDQRQTCTIQAQGWKSNKVDNSRQFSRLQITAFDCFTINLLVIPLHTIAQIALFLV